MHILFGILTVVGVIIYIIIRLNRVNQAGRDIVETASDVKNLVRRSRWKASASSAPLAEIEDPRLAATVSMLAIAKVDGELTERQRAAITEHLQDTLKMDQAESEDMIAEARWMIQDLSDLETVLRRAAKPIEARCTESERRDLIEMLRAVAAIEGPVQDRQELATVNLARALHVDA